MKKLIQLILPAMFASSLSVYADNPIFQTDFTADPAPVVVGDTVFVFTSHDEDGVDYFTMNEWRVFSSTDMVNWTDRGAPMQNSDFAWADKDAAWASQMVPRNGKYYFYVTTTYNGPRAIGVAVADNPAGPYRDALGKPLGGPNWDYIDPTAFVDDDGQAYVYWGNPRLYGGKLKEDMITIDGKIEQLGPNAENECNYTEGPWIHKRGNTYYMMYASHGVPEKISYATSNSPLGPWTFRGIIQESGNRNEVNNFAFTIHSGIIEFKGRAFYFYHNQNLRDEEGYTGGFTRSCCMEEFQFGADGSIPFIPATNLGVKEPIHYLDPYTRVEAETKAYSHGLRMDYRDRNNIFVHGIDNGDYIKVRSVDFGKEGAFKFVAGVRCAEGKGGILEVYLDKMEGTKIASLGVESTGNTWKEIETEADNVMGVHDIYFRFFSQNKEMFEFDYWYFVDQSHNIPQSPFGDKPMTIPGKIEAENYDLGGSGKAFYDKDRENRGEAYRTDAVDVYEKPTGEFVVGYCQEGEWLEYTVNVEKTTDYNITARISTGNPNAGFSLYIDDEKISEMIQTPENEGEWDNFEIYQGKTIIPLTKGEHILKLQIDGDWIDIDWIEFSDPTGVSVVAKKADNTIYTIYNVNGKVMGSIKVEADSHIPTLLKQKGVDKGVYVLKAIDGTETTSVIVE